jgi:hypothetical protein
MDKINELRKLVADWLNSVSSNGVQLANMKSSINEKHKYQKCII